MFVIHAVFHVVHPSYKFLQFLSVEYKKRRSGRINPDVCRFIAQMPVHSFMGSRPCNLRPVTKAFWRPLLAARVHLSQ
jgi:hypothetical protein